MKEGRNHAPRVGPAPSPSRDIPGVLPAPDDVSAKSESSRKKTRVKIRRRSVVTTILLNRLAGSRSFRADAGRRPNSGPSLSLGIRGAFPCLRRSFIRSRVCTIPAALARYRYSSRVFARRGIGRLGGESESAVTAPYAICRNFIQTNRRRARKIENGRADNLMFFFRVSTVKRAREKQGKSFIRVKAGSKLSRKIVYINIRNLNNKFLNNVY